MRKHAFPVVYIFLCAFALSGACALGEDRESSIRAGMRLLSEKNFAAAYDAFLRAKEEHPEMVEIDFMLGLAANGKGDYAAAVGALENALKEMPSSRVKLELATAYAFSGGSEGISRAKELFTEVLADNPPPAVAANIWAILARMDERGEIPGTAALPPNQRSGHSFGGRLTTGVQYDSNPKGGPADTLVSTILGDMLLDPTSRPESSLVWTNQLQLNHIYRFSSAPLVWKTDATLYTALYGRANDMGLLLTQARTGLAYEHERFSLDFLGRFNFFEQDSEAGMRSWGVESNAHVRLLDNWLAVAGWRHDVKVRPLSPSRDGTNDSVHFGTMFILGDRHRFTLFGGPEWERARIDEDSYDRAWISARYDLALPARVTAYASYRYAYSHYRAEEFIFGKTRMDKDHAVTLGLRKVFWMSGDRRRAIDADLSYTYGRTRSNIELYDYKKHVLALDVGFSF